MQKMLACSSDSIANRQSVRAVGVGYLTAFQVPRREGDRCEDQRAGGRPPVRGGPLLRRGRGARVRRTHALRRTHRGSRVRQFCFRPDLDVQVFIQSNPSPDATPHDSTG